MIQQLTLLWGASCLVVLFGIWWTLWSRLPKSNPTQQPKKKITLTEDQLEALLQQRQEPEAPQKEPEDALSRTKAKLAKGAYGKKEVQ